MNKVIYPILLLAVLSGCATPASFEQMTAKKIDTSKIANETPLKNNISLKGVTGGKSTNPLLSSQIGDEEFKQALEQSLKAAKLLASGQGNGSYLLTTTLLSISKPAFGFDYNVTATVEYTLEERATERKVFSKIISTPFTATVSDALYGVERMQFANEGAARKNIEKIVDELLSLNISKQQVSVN